MGRSQRRLLAVTLVFLCFFILYHNGADLVEVNLFSRRETPNAVIDLSGDDVIVSFPVPRTGMTSLTQHLVREVTGDVRCQCQVKLTRCECRNKDANIWLFNAYNSTGHPAGARADLSTLTSFPIDHWFRTSGQDNRPARRYHLVTLLRDPIARYVSEWLYLRRGNFTFHNEPRLWRKESPELQKKELPCLLGIKLSSLTLTEFIQCRNNPANNRQTSAFANTSDLSLRIATDADPVTFRRALISSATQFIQSVPFFGLLSALEDSTALLQRQFGLSLHTKMTTRQTDSDRVLMALSPRLIRQISNLNSLDVKLYRYAIKLFSLRFRSVMGYNVTMLPSPPHPEEDLGYEDPDVNHQDTKLHGGFRVSDLLTPEEMRTDDDDDVDDDVEDDVEDDVDTSDLLIDDDDTELDPADDDDEREESDTRVKIRYIDDDEKEDSEDEENAGKEESYKDYNMVNIEGDDGDENNNVDKDIEAEEEGQVKFDDDNGDNDDEEKEKDDDDTSRKNTDNLHPQVAESNNDEIIERNRVESDNEENEEGDSQPEVSFDLDKEPEVLKRESPDYSLDTEDVSLFLNRVEKIKSVKGPEVRNIREKRASDVQQTRERGLAGPVFTREVRLGMGGSLSGRMPRFSSRVLGSVQMFSFASDVTSQETKKSKMAAETKTKVVGKTTGRLGTLKSKKASSLIEEAKRKEERLIANLNKQA